MAAVPPLFKTWQMTGAFGRTLCIRMPVIDNKAWLPILFRTFTSFALNPYQILGSSDGSTAGMDGVNRLVDSSSVVTTATVGAARSWIVAKNPATGYSILFHCFKGDGVNTGEVYISCTSGFTGGSTTARPTAPDESTPVRTGFLDASTTGDGAQPRTMCVWHTSDGQQTMWATHGQSFGSDSLVMQCWFGNFHNAPPGWTHPMFFGASALQRQGVDGHYMSGSGAAFVTIAEKPASAGGGFFSPYLSSDGVHNGIGPESLAVYWPVASPDGYRICHPIGEVFMNTTGMHGYMGFWPDIEVAGISQADVWSPLAGLGTNGDAPDASRNRILIGTVLYPWDTGPWSI